MDDLISRADALKGFAEYSDGGCYINALPFAQSEQRWIPCKLLDHYYIKELKDCGNKSYLVTYKTKTGRRYVKKVNIYHGKIQSKVGGKVIAWMPLPDAYEEDD